MPTESTNVESSRRRPRSVTPPGNDPPRNVRLRTTTRGHADTPSNLGITIRPNLMDVHHEVQQPGVGGCPAHSINHILQDSVVRPSDLPNASLDQTARHIERYGGVNMLFKVDPDFQGDTALEQALNHVGAALFEVGDVNARGGGAHQITMVRMSDRNPGIPRGGLWVVEESGRPGAGVQAQVTPFRTAGAALNHVVTVNGEFNPDTHGHPRRVLNMAYPDSIIQPQFGGRGAYLADDGYVIQQHLTSIERNIIQGVNPGVTLHPRSRTAVLAPAPVLPAPPEQTTTCQFTAAVLGDVPVDTLHALLNRVTAREQHRLDEDETLLLGMDPADLEDDGALAELLFEHFEGGNVPLTASDMAMLPPEVAARFRPAPAPVPPAPPEIDRYRFTASVLQDVPVDTLHALLNRVTAREQRRLDEDETLLLGMDPADIEDDSALAELLFEHFEGGNVPLTASDMAMLPPEVAARLRPAPAPVPPAPPEINRYRFTASVLQDVPVATLHALMNNVVVRELVPLDPAERQLLQSDPSDIDPPDLVDMLFDKFADGAVPLSAADLAMLPDGVVGQLEWVDPGAELSPENEAVLQGYQATLEVHRLAEIRGRSHRRTLNAQDRRELDQELGDVRTAVAALLNVLQGSQSTLRRDIDQWRGDTPEQQALQFTADAIQEGIGDASLSRIAEHTARFRVWLQQDQRLESTLTEGMRRPPARVAYQLSPANTILVERFREVIRLDLLQREFGASPPEGATLSQIGRKALANHVRAARAFAASAAGVGPLVEPGLSPDLNSWASNPNAMNLLFDMEETLLRSTNDRHGSIRWRFVNFVAGRNNAPDRRGRQHAPTTTTQVEASPRRRSTTTTPVEASRGPTIATQSLQRQYGEPAEAHYCRQIRQQLLDPRSDDTLSADRTAQLAQEQATVGSFISALHTQLRDSNSSAPSEAGLWAGHPSAILAARTLRTTFVADQPESAGAVDRYIRYLETGRVQVPDPPAPPRSAPP